MGTCTAGVYQALSTCLKKGPLGMRLPACVLEAYSDGVMQTLDIQSNHAHLHMQLHTVTYYAA